LDGARNAKSGTATDEVKRTNENNQEADGCDKFTKKNVYFSPKTKLQQRWKLCKVVP
jgi:hypothetical protein